MPRPFLVSEKVNFHPKAVYICGGAAGMFTTLACSRVVVVCGSMDLGADYCYAGLPLALCWPLTRGLIGC